MNNEDRWRGGGSHMGLLACVTAQGLTEKELTLATKAK